MEIKEYISNPEKATVRYNLPAVWPQFRVKESRKFSVHEDFFLSEESKILICLVVLWKISSVVISRSVEHHLNFLEFSFDPSIKSYNHSIEILFNQESGTLDRLWDKAKKSKDQTAQEQGVWIQVGSFEETKKEDPLVSGLKFYELTETAHALLHSAVAAYSRMSLTEKNKPQPDTVLLQEINENKELARKILSKAANFSSLAQLSAIVDKYSPIVKALYPSSESKSKVS